VPYNLRELFDTTTPALTLGLFTAALLLLGATPMSMTIDRPGRDAMLAVGAAVVVAALIAGIAPSESLGDVTGTPLFPEFAVVERAVRLAALLLGVIVCLGVGARLVRRAPCRADLPGLASLALMAAVSWTVVVPMARTDNLTELLRNGGGVWAASGLAALLVLLGSAAATAARAIAGRSLRALLAGLIAIPVTVAPAWSLMVLATEPALDKYGKTFSARQFLLSANRDNYLPDADLLPRFAVAWSAAALAIAVGMTIAILVRDEPGDP
jgi:hypothetical protein